MIEKLFNDIWPMLKKQGLFVITLLVIIYYFNDKVNELEVQVKDCNKETIDQFIILQKNTLIILERLDYKMDINNDKQIKKGSYYSDPHIATYATIDSL